MNTPDVVPSESNAVPVNLGDRVEFRQARGYIRYIGPVEGHKGEWIGVDWDDASRGRHDGCVRGKRYFQATHETSGSFLRAAKMGSGSRRSLGDAIRERLRAERDVLAAGGQGVKSSSVDWMVGNKEVQVAFKTRASNCGNSLHALDVSEMGVCDFGREGSEGFDEILGTQLRNVRSLRVASSLISEWCFVQMLLQKFPELTYLDVSRNKFDLFDWNRNKGGTTSGLEELALNGCNVQLEGVLGLCEQCPVLKHLRLFDTGLNSLRNTGTFDIVNVLSCVRLIDLGGNKIPWSDVQDVLGRMTSLEELFLGDNDIGLHGEELNESGLFPSLHRLSLSDNPISDWKLITSLIRVPSLRSLLIADTPLTKDEKDWDPVTNEMKFLDSSAIASRHGIMGRLGQIQKLHASVIDDDERKYAEKRYLIHDCLPSLKSCKTPTEAEKIHPRMRELCKIYDIDLDDIAKDAGLRTALGQGVTLRADLVNVMFKTGSGVTAKRQEVCKQLPRCVHGAKLRALAKKFLGINVRTTLGFSLEHNGTKSLIRNDKTTLAQLYVKPGDDIVVQVA